MLLLDELFSDIDDGVERRLVTGNVFLESAVLGNEQVDGGQIVTDVASGQDLLLLLDPVLLVGHVPVELPQFAALLQTGPAFNRQFHQLRIRVLQSTSFINSISFRGLSSTTSFRLF